MKTFYFSWIKRKASRGFALLMCICMFVCAGCQSTSQTLRIKPGKRMKSVKLGLSPKQMATIIGQPVAVRQPKDVVENYLMLDINPDTRLLMHSEFDKQMEYSPLNNRKDYPVFTVYYKNDKAVYIIFSSYIYPLHRLENIYIKKHMAFGNIATLLNAIGENYEYAPINNYDGEYLYLQKGISLISENDLVRAIHLYRPLKKNEAIEFMKLRRQ